MLKLSELLIALARSPPLTLPRRSTDLALFDNARDCRLEAPAFWKST
jgi:hypothetical protein